MRLLDYFRSLESHDKQLLKEFCWILEERFSLNEAELLAGTFEINEKQKEVLSDWFNRKKEDYPLQYFLNSTAFLDLDFYISEGALIPRMETEDIVSWILEYYQKLGVTPKSIIDIGTGSGCMGISLAVKLNPDSVKLLEPYSEAQKSLKENYNRFCRDALFEALMLSERFEDYQTEKKFDLIVSNPPYIKIADPEVTNSVYKFEPHEALYGGEFGYETPVAWFKKAVELLSPNGLLVFEMAYNQRDQISEALSDYDLTFMKDRFGKDRFFYYTK